VVAGPDGSGTSTQVRDIIDYFRGKHLRVIDLRGGETDGLFHAREFNLYNHHGSPTSFESYAEFRETNLHSDFKSGFVFKAKKAFEQGRIAACIDDPAFSFVDPEFADVFVLEEPSHRAGESVRRVQLHRSKFGVKDDQYGKAVGYSFDRDCEFLRFRGPLRAAGKVLVRSRGVESAAYQIRDKLHLPFAPSRAEYIKLPGNAQAFANPPTDIIVVHAPEDWTVEEYYALKGDRMADRVIDDHENDAEYQLLVNRRYESCWLEDLYEYAQDFHGGLVPRIHRIPMYDADRVPVSRDGIKSAIYTVLDGICGDF